jgi:hypothetical protein
MHIDIVVVVVVAAAAAAILKFNFINAQYSTS